MVADSQGLVLTVCAFRKKTKCPNCDCASASVHSHYVRTLSDLPWGGTVVRLRLHTRRFFCTNDLCSRIIFTERFSGTVARYGRATLRLHATLSRLGFLAGGEGGARLAGALGMKTSGDTIVRRVRSTPLENLPVPRILGVDDWAMRKGHSYGTILCDLERHRVVDLLPDRTRDGFMEWLHGHPGVEVISRDRASAYAEAASLAAPTAMQVADRWHLLRNIGQALQRVLEREHAQLRRAAQNVVVRKEAGVEGDDLEHLPSPQPSEILRSGNAEKRAAREARYEAVHALAQAGLSRRAITQKTGLDRRTVRGWLKTDRFPERKLPQRCSSVDGFAVYLKRRYAEGCHNSVQLWRELREKGFPGGQPMIRRWVRLHLRSKVTKVGSPAPVASCCMGYSPRQTAWLLLQPRPLPQRPHLYLERLLNGSPQIDRAARIAQELIRIIYQKDALAWSACLEAARATPLAQFVAHLARDEPAVLAALQHRWSNGQVEGQVNRLKAIKRQMFGRAKFDLLRQRVLSVCLTKSEQA